MRTAILFIPSTLIVLALVWHSWRVRGARETALFFPLALLFGIVRGNIIWWITTVHFKGSFPYVFSNRVMGFFHDSLQADIGWILTLYVGYSSAEWLLRRIPGRAHSFFHTITLSGLFAVCLSYAVETTAMAMGWWNWNITTHSRFFIDVPMAGIAAWFSVPIDFLTPFLLLVRAPRRYRPWGIAALGLFPLHMIVHLSNQRLSAAVPLTPYNVYYWMAALAALVLPLAFRVPLRPYRDAVPRSLRGAHLLIPAAMAGVVGVLLAADLGVLGRAGLLISQLPLVLYLLLVYVPVSPLYALAVGAAATALGGLVFLTSLLPVLIVLLLHHEPRLSAWRWRWAVVIGLPLLLTVMFHVDALRRDRVDRAYLAACAEARSLARKGDLEGSVRRYGEATAIKPVSVRAWQELGMVQMQRKDWNGAEVAFKATVERRPVSPEAWNALASVYLLRGDRELALATFRRALQYDPQYGPAKRAVEMLQGSGIGAPGSGPPGNLTPGNAVPVPGGR
jgi:hypothetical protein